MFFVIPRYIVCRYVILFIQKFFAPSAFKKHQSLIFSVLFISITFIPVRPHYNYLYHYE
jgi:Cu/Ag efflux pump CusA